MTAPDSSALSITTPSLWRSAAKRLGQALWVVILPAALAVLVLRFLVPPIGTGFPGLVSTTGGRFPLPFAVGLFVLFSALAHHWRSHLPEALREWVVPAAASKKSAGREVVSLVLVLFGAVVAALVVRVFVRPYRVLSSSMLPTLETDDLVLGRMLPAGASAVAGLRRGDVVVFRGTGLQTAPGTLRLPDIVVKRVIGLPGDRIAMQGNQPVINGWMMPSCEAGEYIHVASPEEGGVAHAKLFVEFLDDRAYLAVYSMGGAQFRGTYVVKPGEVFVLGDNRGNSVDSRSFDGGHGGGVPDHAIEARASTFLVGTTPSGDADYSRFLGRVDTSHVRLPLPFPATSLDDGIARCLANRPKDAHPPPP